jgi:hypothetical protein
MRKSEVFKQAALHLDGEERKAMAVCSRYFFSYSVSALSSFESRHLTRPMALMLAFGWTETGFRRNHWPLYPRPEAYPNFGLPETFVSQRERALRRLMLVAVGTATVVALFAWFAFA